MIAKHKVLPRAKLNKHLLISHWTNAGLGQTFIIQTYVDSIYQTETHFFQNLKPSSFGFSTASHVIKANFLFELC